MSAAVTIVIPIWDDHVALLPRCLKSIADQEVPSEILVVDNASRTPIDPPSDGRLISLSARQTVGAARNVGLGEVTTPFVVFADADDELADGALARGARLLEKRSVASGVIGRSLVDEYGERLRRGRTPSNRFLACSRFLPELAPIFWLANFQASITSTILRTSAVKAAGGFADADIGEDWLLAARLARRGRLICLTEPVRIYHRHRAALRNTCDSRPSTAAMRRAVREDCIGDANSTRLQRLVADFLLRRDGARSPAD